MEKLLARTSSQQKPQSISEPQLEMIGKLFVRMAAAYGHLWSSQFKTPQMIEITKREWLKSLGGYSFERIDQAFEKCKTDYLTVPTLGQFLTCFQVVPYHQPFDRSGAIAHQETAKAKERRMKIGEQAIMKMKGMLKNAHGSDPVRKDYSKGIENKKHLDKVLSNLEKTYGADAA